MENYLLRHYNLNYETISTIILSEFELCLFGYSNMYCYNKQSQNPHLNHCIQNGFSGSFHLNTCFNIVYTRRVGMVSHLLALQVSVWKWYTFLPHTFHLSHKVTDTFNFLGGRRCNLTMCLGDGQLRCQVYMCTEGRGNSYICN